MHIYIYIQILCFPIYLYMSAFLKNKIYILEVQARQRRAIAKHVDFNELILFEKYVFLKNQKDEFSKM